ncbi:NAD(P)H-dependent oxidoreductase subunit E, partial [Pelagibacterales bacterium]|nr:NAD(P)H-dependent oxidoreductase subunit E [Pelagibacterales bacterium]
LRGSEHVVRACKEIISENPTEVSSDNLFSWMEVECLGACVNAPMVQINDDFYEDLNYESTKDLLLSLIDNKPLQVGSQIGRQGSKGVSDVK